MEQLRRDQREADQAHHRHDDAEREHALAIARGQAGGERADDHRIVAREDQVDEHDLTQGGEPGGGEDVSEVEHGRTLNR